MRAVHWTLDFLDFYVRRKIFRQRVPLFASFKLTYHCNLSCEPCPFHRRASEQGSSLTWDGAVEALNHLRRLGTRIVVFEGGEPFLWKDGDRGLREIVQYARRHFLRVAVATNGTFPLNVPADAIWISIDGLKETHDRLRSGSYDRIRENLAAAEQFVKQPTRKRTRIMAHFTMNRVNWRELGPLAEELKEHPVVGGISVQLFYSYRQGESRLDLPNQELKMALENAILLKRSHPIINSARCLKAMIRNDWRCHDDLLINVDPTGTVTQGCYVKGRGEIDCSRCGFTPVAEASAALDLQPGALLAGWRAYLS
jgi:MoaA/NifB/PqqE/SkfB family radical SAM enzyme